MKISRILFAAVALTVAASCGPQAYLLDMQKRGASPSGMNVNRRNISVVYVSPGNMATFSNAVASGFAWSLEKELFDGEQSIGVFSVPGGGDNYSSRDSLVKYVVETGSDLVFLLDEPAVMHRSVDSNKPVESGKFSADSSYFAEGTLTFNLKMYAYDGLGKEDEVRVFSGSNTIHPKFFNPGGLSDEKMEQLLLDNSDVTGFQVGVSASKPFIPEWKNVGYLVYYYENEKWEDLLELAFQMKWQEALDGWLKIADAATNAQKRAAAEFNIATACHILGQNALATEWLDRSEADCKMNGTDALRRKILADM